MATSLTQELGAFVAGFDAKTLPPEAAEVVRMGVIDTVGVMTVGQAEPGPGSTRTVEGWPPSGMATSS